jgi:hypothetical protein
MESNHTKGNADGEKREMKEDSLSHTQTALKVVVPSKMEQCLWEILPI